MNPSSFDPPNGQLLVYVGDAEASPAVTAMLFGYDRSQQIGCRIGGQAKTFDAHTYVAASKTGTAWVWNSDIAQGKFGYILVGGASGDNLWKIRRVETDFANRFIFTLYPVAPSNGLPSVTLDSIQDPIVKQQTDQHWREFVEAFSRRLPYRTVNAAKDICENVLYDILLRHGLITSKKHELGDLLKRLFEEIQSNQGSTQPFRWIHFHLMQKIRLLHGRIHASRTAREGALSAELALSVWTDLVEVLKAAGLVADENNRATPE